MTFDFTAATVVMVVVIIIGFIVVAGVVRWALRQLFGR